MSAHPDISVNVVDRVNVRAAAIRRRYLASGGSDNDWLTDLSHLIAAVLDITARERRQGDRRVVSLPVEVDRRQADRRHGERRGVAA